MHRVSTARLLSRALGIGERAASVPVFLCPAVGLRSSPAPRAPGNLARSSRRFNGTGVSARAVEDGPPARVDQPVRQLPVTCSGCGAFAQTGDAQQLGYFDLQSRRVRNWLRPRKSERPGSSAAAAEDKIVDDVLKGLDEERLEALGLRAESMMEDASARDLESKCHGWVGGLKLGIDRYWDFTDVFLFGSRTCHGKTACLRQMPRLDTPQHGDRHGKAHHAPPDGRIAAGHH